MTRIAYGTLLAVLSLGACTDSDDDNYPVEPSTVAPPSSGSGGTMRVTSRVCVIDDLRAPATCGTRNAGGLTVTSGSSATTTDSAGNFTIDVDPRLDPSVTATGAGITPTSLPVGENRSIDIVPAIDADVYARMLSSNGIELSPGMGSILTSVTADGQPATGIGLTSTPNGPYGVFFDGDGPLNWGLDGTGARGVAWIPGVTAGSVDLSYQGVLGGLETQVGGVTVRNGGVTILDTALTGGSGI